MRKPGILICFEPAYHGRSVATSQLTSTTRVQGLGNFQTQQMPYPDCTRCPLGLKRESCRAQCFEPVIASSRDRCSELSAVLIEPAMGARGYEFPPRVFFEAVAGFAREQDCLFIVDEIQMGLGRMGNTLASALLGMEPDVVLLGKSLGGGVAPISAMLAPQAIMDSIPAGIESETFAGQPFACRTALKVLDILEQPGYLQGLQDLGVTLRKILNEILKALPIPYFIEGVGPNAAIEWYPNDTSHGADVARWVQIECVKAGLLVQRSGRYNNRIVWIPPFEISHEELVAAADIFAAAVQRVLDSCY